MLCILLKRNKGHPHRRRWTRYRRCGKGPGAAPGPSEKERFSNGLRFPSPLNTAPETRATPSCTCASPGRRHSGAIHPATARASPKPDPTPSTSLDAPRTGRVRLRPAPLPDGGGHDRLPTRWAALEGFQPAGAAWIVPVAAGAAILRRAWTARLRTQPPR